MSTQLQDIMDYIEEECNCADANLIYDEAHKIALKLLLMGDNGVLIANMVAAQLNDHTMQNEGAPSPTLH